MFESYELPRPDDVGALDDLELVDAAEAATLMEIVAIDLRLAALHEMYRRQLPEPAETHPTPQHPRPALQRSPRRRRRRNRKRKQRR